MKRKNTKICTFTAALLICCLSAASVYAAASGDINGDGEFNSSDIKVFAEYMTGKKNVSIGSETADFDGDGKISIVDYIMAKNAVLENGTSSETEDGTVITLNGNSITASGDVLPVISGSKALINASGTYYVEGKLNDGQIAVNVPETDTGTVKLVFRGVEITGTSEAPVYIINAEKTSITLEEGTTNILRDGETYTETEAVIHAKDDLTLKGDGRLEIYSGTHYGIHCNNDLKINGPELYVETEAEDAVRGKTSVTVKDGSIEIFSEGDGIKSTKGNVEISGGTVSIKAKSDAVQAETTIDISGGDITACGGRGLTAVEKVNITGGSVLATAADEQCSTLSDVSTGAMLLDYSKEWSKNNPVTLTDSTGKTVFDKNTLKKFSYALVADETLSGTYTLWTGGIKMASASGESFKTGKPASYKDVNNSEENEVLYGEIFDQTRVHSIKIDMPEEDWNDLVKNATKEEYYAADVTIDGVTIKNAAVRAKGLTSLSSIASSGGDKFSLRIKLDKYNEYQNYKGLTEFCMNNFYGDPSAMRDKLCYDAVEELNGYGPETSYTDVYMNGELFSFYLLCEVPSETLAERYSTNDDTTLYKADEMTCTLQTDQSLDAFSVKYGPDEEKTHITEVVKAINNVTADNYKFIEDIVDVSSFLKGFAVNAFMCNYDSYNGSIAHNYYLLWNDGKMSYVAWDYNLSMGGFMGGSAQVNSDITTALYSVSGESRPMVSKLLAVPEYYDMYVGYVQEIIDMYSNPETKINEYADLISSHIKADPRYLFSYEDFEKNITKTDEGLQVDESQNGMGNWGNMGDFDFGNMGNFDFGNMGDFSFSTMNGTEAGISDLGTMAAADEAGAAGGFGGNTGNGGFGGWGGNGGGDFGGFPGNGGNGGWGGGDFGGFGGGFNGSSVCITDFLIKRLEVVKAALGM